MERPDTSGSRDSRLLSCVNCENLVAVGTAVGANQTFWCTRCGGLVSCFDNACPAGPAVGSTTVGPTPAGSTTDDSELLRILNPDPEDIDVVLVDFGTMEEAQQFIVGCEQCSETAEIPFDSLLDAMTGCDPRITEYLLCEPARCPNCHAEVTEKTLILSESIN